MCRLLVVFGCLIAGFFVPVQASESKDLADQNEISLIFGLNSYHFSENPEHNNSNDIVGVLYKNWFLTRFTNSHHGQSWGFGRTLGNAIYHPDWSGNFQIRGRFWAGAATGYGDRLKIHYGPLTFAFLPEVALEYQINHRWSTGVSGLYIWTDKGGVWVNGLQVKYRF